MRGASVNKAIIEWVIARKPKRWELGPRTDRKRYKEKSSRVIVATCSGLTFDR